MHSCWLVLDPSRRGHWGLGCSTDTEGSATLNFPRRDSGIFRFLAWFRDSWINFCDSCLPNKGLWIAWFIIYEEMLNIQKETLKFRFSIQESPIDSLIPAVIPRAIDVIRNSCGPLDWYRTVDCFRGRLDKTHLIFRGYTVRRLTKIHENSTSMKITNYTVVSNTMKHGQLSPMHLPALAFQKIIRSA